MKKLHISLIVLVLAAILAVAPSLASQFRQASFAVPSTASAKVSAEGCTNNPGPYITLSGELALTGVNGRLIFRNNKKGTHEHEEETTLDINIIPTGEKISFAKQPPLGGAGRNPLVYFQFTDNDGNAYSDEFFLGRCVQL